MQKTRSFDTVHLQPLALFILDPPLADANTGKKARGLARLRGLLNGISQPDQRGVAPGASEKRNSYGQAGDESARHVDVWIAGDRGGVRTASRESVAIHQVCQPCGSSSGRDDGI